MVTRITRQEDITIANPNACRWAQRAVTLKSRQLTAVLANQIEYIP